MTDGVLMRKKSVLGFFSRLALDYDYYYYLTISVIHGYIHKPASSESRVIATMSESRTAISVFEILSGTKVEFETFPQPSNSLAN